MAEERYALFQDTKKFEIHHLEWSIHKIDIRNLEVEYPRFKNLLQNKPNKIQYSKGVKVLAWNKNK